MSDYMPTRSQAEKNKPDFYRLVRKVLENKSALLKHRVTLKNLGDEIGINTTTVKRQLDSENVSDENRVLILDYIFKVKMALTGEFRARALEFPHFLYFALLEFFDIKETSQDNARAHICGTYELWRYSVEDDDEFVHGKIEFSVDPESNAVCAEMWQPKKNRDGLRASNEEFEGYFVRVADMYAMILKDKSSTDLRITIFPRFRIESIGKHIDKDSEFPEHTNHIVHLDGFGLGIDGNNLFFSPVYLALVDNENEMAELDDKLDVVPEERVPPRILKRLKRYSRILK